jgi:nucleotide-binding universal stress UspA family protein
MISLQRILVPHDFSALSEAAFTYATGLASSFHAALDLLHVVPERGVDAGPAEAAFQQLRKHAAQAGKTGLKTRCHVRSGTPDVEITRFARECTVDLIVMGTHGRGVVSHALMGSVAEQVVRSAPCPVLTVHGPQRESAVPNILVALAFEPASDTALTYARALARASGGTLHVLHVMENDFLRPMASDPYTLVATTRNRVCDRLTEEDAIALRAQVEVEVSDAPAEAIIDYARSSGIDLIVLGTHGRRGANRLLMGSVAERVVRAASCPVLTVRHPEREFVRPDRDEAAAVIS